MKKVLAAAAAVGLGAVFAFAAPANATNTGDGKEKVEKFHSGQACAIPGLNYNKTGDLKLSNGATAETANNGILLYTPVKADHSAKLSWSVGVSPAIGLNKLSAAGYVLTKKDMAGPGVNDAALLSYDLVIDKDGNGTSDFTLVYEPYYNNSGNPTRNSQQFWDVKSGKFWANKAAADTWLGNEPGGGSYAGNKTVAQILVFWPNAKITGYGYHQGTYNDGTVSLLTGLWFDTDDSVQAGYVWTSFCNKQNAAFKDTCEGTEVTLSNTVAYLETKFYVNGTEVWVSSPKKSVVSTAEVMVSGKTKNFLAKHTWVRPESCVVASPTPSNSVTASPTPSSSTAVTLPPVNNPNTSLPVTGSKVAVIAGTGGAMVLLGLVLLVWRRKQQPTTKFIVE